MRATGVLLTPDRFRGESRCSVSLEDSGTRIVVREAKYLYPGRPLLLLTDPATQPEVLTESLDLDLYESRERMQEAVKAALERASKPKK